MLTKIILNSLCSSRMQSRRLDIVPLQWGEKAPANTGVKNSQGE